MMGLFPVLPTSPSGCKPHEGSGQPYGFFFSTHPDPLHLKVCDSKLTTDQALRYVIVFCDGSFPAVCQAARQWQLFQC